MKAFVRVLMGLLVVVLAFSQAEAAKLSFYQDGAEDDIVPIVNGVGLYPRVAPGGAVTVNASTYIDLGDHGNQFTESMTVEAWLTTDLGGHISIDQSHYLWYAGGDGWSVLIRDNGKVTASQVGPSGYSGTWPNWLDEATTSAAPVTAGVLHQVVAQMPTHPDLGIAERVEIFVDGVQYAVTRYPGKWLFSRLACPYVNFRIWAWGAVNASVQRVTLYDRILSSSEIAALYAAGPNDPAGAVGAHNHVEANITDLAHVSDEHIEGLAQGLIDADNALDDAEYSDADHAHTYLTGKGEGHNNTGATTSVPLE